MKKFLSLLLLTLGLSTSSAQVTQTQNAPIYAANAKYVQGWSPDYSFNQATSSGLVFGLLGGTTFSCGVLTEYTGGTFVLPENTTVYVFLDTTSACTPQISTTTFNLATQIPLFIVQTGASTWTSILDVRTLFNNALTSPPSGPAGGDLSGTYPDPVVHRVNGGAVPLSALTIGTNGSGQLVTGPTSLPPNGAAGGDLSGTYPNPVVHQVNSGAVPVSSPYVGTNASGQIIPATTPLLPQTFAAITNEFLTSYTASTGLFTAAQPSFANLSGSATAAQTPTACQLAGCTLTGAFSGTTGTFSGAISGASITDTGLPSHAFIGTNSSGLLIAATLPTQPVTFTAVANEFLTSYTSSTGLFTAAQPSFSNLTGSATAAQTPTACQLTGCTLTGAFAATTGTFSGSLSGASVIDTGLLSATTVGTNGSGQFIAGPSSLPPSGTAGGDLSGSYPNPTVHQVNGGAIPLSSPYVGTNASGQIVVATTPILPATFAAVTNEFLTSYTSSTGLFTAAQPSFSNLTGSATAAQTPTACQLTGCALTGAFSATTGNFSGTLTATGSINAQTGINIGTGGFGVTTAGNATFNSVTTTFDVTANSFIATNGFQNQQVGTGSSTPLVGTQTSLATGNVSQIIVGIDSTCNDNNAFDIDFNNVGGSGSTSNTMTLGLCGDPQLTVSSAGTLTVPSTVTATGFIDTGLISAATVATNGSGQFIPGPSSLPPSGTAGGDLSGTYPNPTVAQIEGAAIPASATYIGTNASKQIIAAPAACQLTGCALTGAGTGTFEVIETGTVSTVPVLFLQPSVATGNSINFVLGAAFSTNNSALISFNNVGGSGSSSNTMSIGLLNGSTLTIGSTGTLNVPSTVTATSGTFSTSLATNSAPVSIVAASLNTGATTGIDGGLAISTSSDFDVLFENVGGLGSASNLMMIGLVNDPQVTIDTSGDINVPGNVIGAQGEFNAISGTSGSFTGNVHMAGLTATGGTFSGNVSVLGFTANGEGVFLDGVVSSSGYAGNGSVTLALGTSTTVGSGATVTCTTGHSCDQFSGDITLVTGTTPTTTGALVTVTFPTPRSNTPNCTISTFNQTIGLGVSAIFGTTTSSTLAFNSGTSPASGSTSLRLMYVCGGI